MPEEHLLVLLVDGNQSYASLAEQQLRSRLRDVVVTRRVTLRDGIVAAQTLSFDVILLDLCLPDAEGGMATLRAFLPYARHTAIIAMTTEDDPDLGMAAVAAGAQDLFVKDRTEVGLFVMTVHHAVARHRQLMGIRRHCWALGSELKKVKALVDAVQSNTPASTDIISRLEKVNARTAERLGRGLSDSSDATQPLAVAAVKV